MLSQSVILSNDCLKLNATVIHGSTQTSSLQLAQQQPNSDSFGYNIIIAQHGWRERRFSVRCWTGTTQPRNSFIPTLEVHELLNQHGPCFLQQSTHVLFYSLSITATVPDWIPDPSTGPEIEAFFKHLRENLGKRHLPPLYLSNATRALYEKAVAGPSSLSDEERREILQRLPREEEDALCFDICESTMSELVTKAIQDPDPLVYTETNILLGDIPHLRGRKTLQQSMRLKGADKDLHHKALKAAMTEEEHAAQTACRVKEDLIYKTCDAAKEALDVYDKNIIKRGALHQFGKYVPWQEHIMSLSGSTKTRAPCGFVVFYPKDKGPECSAFKKRLGVFDLTAFIFT